MALPNVDKPDINDTITDILTDITENCSYLDTEPSAYCVKLISRAWSGGSGTEAVTTGFQPRTLIAISNITGLGSSCIGYYGLSDTSSQFYRTKRRYFVGGSYSSDKWDSGGGGSYCMYLHVDYDGILVRMFGGISSVNATGFVWLWNMTANGLFPAVDPTINVMCIAIK